MPKVILHIGMNKTGSSAIQTYLHSNRARLRDYGLLWPETGLGTKGQGEGYHYGLSTALGFTASRDSAAKAADPGDLRASLDAEIAACNPKTVVISSEFFVLRRPTASLAAFFNGLDTRVVVYLRRHDSWWPSLYAQAIKTANQPPWDRDFVSYRDHVLKLQQQHFRFGDLLEAMADVFGQDRLLVCPYEKQQLKPDLVTSFLHRIDASHISDLVPPDTRQRVNPSLSLHSLSLIDWVQRKAIPPRNKGRIIRAIMAEDTGGSGPALVPDSLRRQLAEDHLADYQQIAETYLNREDGILFRDPLPAPPETGNSNDTGRLPSPQLIANSRAARLLKERRLPSLTIHIGAPKTATTFLQSTFSQARHALAKDGVIYPKSNWLHHAQHRLALAAKTRRVTGTDDIPDLNAELKQLNAVITKADPGKRVFISSEEFLSAPEDAIRAVKDGIDCNDIRILVVVRRPDNLLLSIYNQHLKSTQNNFWQRIDAFAEDPGKLHPVMDQVACVERWARVFGRDKMTIWTYEDTDIVNDCLHLLGASPFAAPPDALNNASMSAATLEVMRYAKAHRMAPPLRKELLRLAERLFRDYPKATLPIKMRRQIVARYESDFDALFATLDRPNPYRAENISQADADQDTVPPMKLYVKLVESLLRAR
jgi:hypothetical protein